MLENEERLESSVIRLSISQIGGYRLHDGHFHWAIGLPQLDGVSHYAREFKSKDVRSFEGEVTTDRIGIVATTSGSIPSIDGSVARSGL